MEGKEVLAGEVTRREEMEKRKDWVMGEEPGVFGKGLEFEYKNSLLLRISVDCCVRKEDIWECIR